MNMAILVTGSSGLIGSYFISKTKNKLPGKVFTPNHQELDISNSLQVDSYCLKIRPDIIINFAAFRNASLAELQRGDHQGSVWKSNVTGVENLIKYCQKSGSYLIHISSDYVFSGSENNPGPYNETSLPKDNNNLLSWYGITKKASEKLILTTYPNSTIIRIGNVCLLSNEPQKDYVGKIVTLYKQGNLYPVFKDQQLSLSYIPHLIEVIQKLISQPTPGIFHVASTDLCSPYQIANYISGKINHGKFPISSTSLETYLEKNPRRYPKNGGLIGKETQKKLNIKFYPWKKIVSLYLNHHKL